MLLDVGAGQGYLALAAAARGHRSLAFEADPVALASLNASLAFNGFQHLVTVHQVSLGLLQTPAACLLCAVHLMQQPEEGVHNAAQCSELSTA